MQATLKTGFLPRAIPVKHKSIASPSPMRTAGWSFLRHRPGVIGLGLTVTLVVVAVLAPLIAPFDPLAIRAADRLSPPSAMHWFGADEFGRDILSRILVGSRISLGVGFVSIGISATLGVMLGLITGFVGGWLDTLVMRFFDALLAFPAILLAIVILAVLGPGAQSAILAIAIVNLPAFSRLTRANVLVEKEKEYVEAARAIGAKTGWIIFRTIFPNVLSTLLVQITNAIAGAVLLEAALSFLGLGTPLPAPSWGSMLSLSKGYLAQAPWYGFFPGLALTLLVLGLYLLGNGLRDALDPRRQKLI